MCGLFLISENSSCRGPVQIRPDALRSHSSGAPFSKGTIHVSQRNFGETTVYAMRAPSAEKTGLIFTRLSFVSWTGSPSGSVLTYTWPGPKNVEGPRIKVTMRPSGESAGWLTESGSLVIWTHSDRLGGAVWPRDQT